MLMVTTETISGYEIEEYLGYISETVTLGINDFLEFFQIADTFGGESSSYKSKFDEAKGILNKRLEAKAKEIQGNAIIGLRINYTEITGRGKSSILVSGTGTVVKVEMTEEHKNKLKEKIEIIEKIETENIMQMQICNLIKYIEKTPKEDKKKVVEKILIREDVKKIREVYKYFSLDGLYQEKIMNMNSYKLKDNPVEKERIDSNIRLEILLRQIQQEA